MTSQALPNHFIQVEHPELIIAMDYATPNNLVGEILDGYEAPKVFLTAQAHTALLKAMEALKSVNPNYTFKIFDAYRPTRAVKHMQSWSHQAEDLALKAKYHPNVSKTQMFEQGYIASYSSHSRGSTLDLTIVECSGGDCHELDMGTIFDFMDERSNTDYPHLSDEAKANRALLQSVMSQAGFVNLPLEWWHFTLKDEPYQNDYFDFIVK